GAQFDALPGEGRNRTEALNHAAAGAGGRLVGAAGGDAFDPVATPVGAVDDGGGGRRAAGVRQGRTGRGGGRLGQGGGRDQGGRSDQKNAHWGVSGRM